MKSVALTVYPRTHVRRSAVKKLRQTGRVPAVMYGGQATPRTLEVPLKELEDLIHHSVSENILVDLTVTGDTQAQRLALVQEVQHHPLSGKVLHVDFHEVSADEKVIITVPVESVGEPAGVKTGGGVLEHVLFKLKVRALPKDLPEFLEVDVSHLEIGQAVHLGDIIHGGKSWMGIAAKDLERQYRDYREATYALNPLLFTVKGEKDQLDDRADQYTRHTGRKSWYSFNYGSLHFIVLDTCDPAPCAMSPAQMTWLKTDLRRYRRHPAVFVFAHHPLVKNPREGADDDSADCRKLAPLHDLFAKYPVKAVFSGHQGAFFEEKKDKILYVTAGSDFAGLSAKSQARRRDANQYYIVEYLNDAVAIRAGKLD